MKVTSPEDLSKVPVLRWTPVFYRILLRVTRRHGLFTIARSHVRRYPEGQVIETRGGGRMYIPPDPHFIGFLTGLHEEHVLRVMRDVIDPGSLCFDVGANIGYFTVMMSALAGPTGCVHAFEPEEANFGLLRLNASLATLNEAPVIARNEAVSDECGFVSLVDGGESTLHQVFKRADVPSPGVLTKATTLDSMMGEIGSRKIRLLKVDVEGHELSVITGAEKLFDSRAIENLIIEVTPGSDAARLEELIRPHARTIRVWSCGEWVETPMSSLRSRTDVWVRF